MNAALLFVLMTSGQADESVQLEVAFESMHCAECRTELERAAGKVSGLQSMKITGSRLLLTISERVPLPVLNRLPRDLKVRSMLLTLSGTAIFSEKKISFVARGSGTTLALADPTRPPAGRLAELRKQQGGKNRFRITGTLMGGRTLVLSTFRKTEWKDR